MLILASGAGVQKPAHKQGRNSGVESYALTYGLLHLRADLHPNGVAAKFDKCQAHSASTK